VTTGFAASRKLGGFEEESAMRAIVLHKVIRDAVAPAPVAPAEASNVVSFTDTDDVGENQGAAQSPVLSDGTPAVTQPLMVNVETIRNITPRRETRGPGSRLTFIDGGGYAVIETFEEVQRMLVASGAVITDGAGLTGTAN
jgi:hypothetical protein